MYYKLFALSHARLTMMRIFLVAVRKDVPTSHSLQDVERMLPGLSRSVDMGLVTILAWCAGPRRLLHRRTTRQCSSSH